MCVSGFSSEKARYGQFNSVGIIILLYQNILYRNCIFQYIFRRFSAYLTIFCSQFTIKCLRLGQKLWYGWETWNTQMSRLMTKPRKWHVCPAKTQISLGIHPLIVQQTLIRLSGCPGWSDPSLGTQSVYWFCHEVAQIFLGPYKQSAAEENHYEQNAETWKTIGQKMGSALEFHQIKDQLIVWNIKCITW